MSSQTNTLHTRALGVDYVGHPLHPLIYFQTTFYLVIRERVNCSFGSLVSEFGIFIVFMPTADRLTLLTKLWSLDRERGLHLSSNSHRTRRRDFFAGG